ncbi:MAG: PorT family protein [Dysgonamonadaceae bacterium]|jgi:hypothetical protein|nr:PorT family protein [Dysgonamonadaceae bacterium]
MAKNIFILLVFMLFACPLFAQKQKVQNQPYGDYKPYHFGISIGMNFQDILLTNAGIPAEAGETWFATIPDYSPGFSAGLLADLYLNPYMNLRFTPILHFGDKIFEFVEPESRQSYRTVVRSNYLTAPLDLKIRSVRLNNYRPYVIAGAYAALDLGRKTDEAVYLNPIDYGLTIGLGCDFYLPIIKVAPELRFSFGLPDVITHNRTDLTDNSLRKYSDAIAKGKTRMISLVIHFE